MQEREVSVQLLLVVWLAVSPKVLCGGASTAGLVLLL